MHNTVPPLQSGSALLIIGLIAALSCSCSRTQNAQAEDLKVSDAPTVAVAKAGVENISRGIVLTAEFKPFQEIDVMAKVAGYVKKINVDVGDRVQEGQLLALIEVPEMADDQTRAESMLNRSQAELARARDELQRAESSHRIAHLSYTRLSEVGKQKAGLIAQQEIDDVQSKDLVAEAQVSAGSGRERSTAFWRRLSPNHGVRRPAQTGSAPAELDGRCPDGQPVESDPASRRCADRAS